MAFGKVTVTDTIDSAVLMGALPPSPSIAHSCSLGEPTSQQVPCLLAHLRRHPVTTNGAANGRDGHKHGVPPRPSGQEQWTQCRSQYHAGDAACGPTPQRGGHGADQTADEQAGEGANGSA